MNQISCCTSLAKKTFISMIAVAMLVPMVFCATETVSYSEPDAWDGTVDLSDGILSAEEHDALTRYPGSTAEYDSVENVLSIYNVRFSTTAATAILSDKPLTVEVDGYCTVKSIHSGDDDTYGIYADGINIVSAAGSTGSLKVCAGNVVGSSGDHLSIGMRSASGITTSGVIVESDGGDVDADGSPYSCGMYGTDITFNDSKVTSRSGTVKGMYAHSYAIYCGTGDVVVDRTDLETIGGKVDNGYNGESWQAGIFVYQGAVGIIKGSHVDITTENTELNDNCQEYNSFGVRCTNDVTITSSSLSIALGNMETDCECMPHMNGIQSFNGRLSVTDSQIRISCGGISYRGIMCVSIQCGAWVESAMISDSLFISTGDDSVGEGKCQSHGLLASNDITVMNGSFVYVRSGNTYGQLTENDGMNGRNIHILDSVVSSYGGTADSVVMGSSFGMAVKNDMEMRNSRVISVALNTRGCTGLELYFGVWMFGTLGVYDSSFIAEGRDGCLGNNVKSIDVSPNMKVYASMPFDDPVFEDVTGKEIKWDYTIIRFVTDDDYTIVTYDLGGVSGIPPATDLAIIGFQYAPKACDASQYGLRFVGWSDGERIYQPGEKIIMGFGPMHLTAVWEHDESTDYPEYGWLVIGTVFAALIVVGSIAITRKQ